jgi:FkbM family methyltransferase
MISVKRAIKYTFNSLLSFVDYEIKRKYIEHNLESFLFKIRANGIAIDTVYDIGAFKGEWAKEVSQMLDMESEFYLFEPNTTYNEMLTGTKFPFFNLLLSSSVKLAPFYAINSTGDSIFKEIGKHYKNVEPIFMMTTTLDIARSELNIPLPDLIKIDTQGSEIDILKGGLATFVHSKVIILEIPVTEYNIGAPKFDEYIDFLLEYSFVPIALTEVHIINGCIVQLDIAFMPKNLASILRVIE